MSAHNVNPLSMGQIEADLFMAKSAMDQATTMSSKRGKFFRGQAGYHLQQATEKMLNTKCSIPGYVRCFQSIDGKHLEFTSAFD